MSDDNYCKTHKIQKTWLLTSSFCPECEKIKHGNKGTVAPAKSHDEYLDDIFGEIELVEEEETVPDKNPFDLDFNIGVQTEADAWEEVKRFDDAIMKELHRRIEKAILDSN